MEHLLQRPSVEELFATAPARSIRERERSPEELQLLDLAHAIGAMERNRTEREDSTFMRQREARRVERRNDSPGELVPLEESRLVTV